MKKIRQGDEVVIVKPDGKGHTIIANAAVVVYFDMEAATGVTS